jgi:hypothetical protein
MNTLGNLAIAAPGCMERWSQALWDPRRTTAQDAASSTASSPDQASSHSVAPDGTALAETVLVSINLDQLIFD